MKKYIHYDDKNTAKIISDTPIKVLSKEEAHGVTTYDTARLYDKARDKRRGEPLKLAYVCNWGQHCGISTYSSFVHGELSKISPNTVTFSEHPNAGEEYEVSSDVNYCWKRGEPLKELLSEIRHFNPNFVVIQHEWGVFPNTRYFMHFLLELREMNLQYIVVMHSVYNHLDKSIPVSIMDNIVVHSSEAAGVLRRNGFKGELFVIPHGCPDRAEPKNTIWNIMKTPYSIFGYGFGFKYKGVEIAIRAIHQLVKEFPTKYGEILYTYVCSESANCKGIHESYMQELRALVRELDIEKNVILIKGYMEPEALDVWLRTVKMAVFPYVVEPDGVFGSSGAIKIAMSYNIPVIGSKSHLFDDVDGYVARVGDHLELAGEINDIFNSSKHRQHRIDRAHEYIAENSWARTAERYLSAIQQVRSS